MPEVNPPPSPPFLSWPGLAELVVTKEDSCFNLAWEVDSLQLVEDCFGEIGRCNCLFISVLDFGSAHWFGGPEQLVQRFPISKATTRQRIPYLPGDMLQVRYDQPGHANCFDFYRTQNFTLEGWRSLSGSTHSEELFGLVSSLSHRSGINHYSNRDVV